MKGGIRVIAGAAKGRRLEAPAWEGLRPTSDRLRETLFNILAARIEGARVLDGYAGTGALGIEALSRGAAHATFVESDRAALAALRANLATTGFEAWATVRVGDATRVDLPPVDVAFADPPYAFTGWPALLARIHADLLVIESDREIDVPGGWRVLRSKKYGTTVVALTSPRSTT